MPVENQDREELFFLVKILESLEYKKVILGEEKEQLDIEERKTIKDILVKANDLRLRLLKPKQSHFRVFAILVYNEENYEVMINDSNTEGKNLKDKAFNFHYILGNNDEPVSISGSICAERACLVQLHTRKVDFLHSIFIVTDSPEPISPGCLCREFLMCKSGLGGEIKRNLNIHLANNDCSKSISTTISEIFPYPSLYTFVDRNSLEEFATNFRGKFIVNRNNSFNPEEMDIINTSGLDMDNIIESMKEEMGRFSSNKKKLDLHPIFYMAGIFYSDGTNFFSFQVKGLEYGTTIDAIQQLSYMIERKQNDLMNSDNRVNQSDSANIAFLCLMDQYHIFHSLPATARAYLSEEGYQNIYTVFHTEDGNMNIKNIDSFFPDQDLSLMCSSADFDL